MNNDIERYQFWNHELKNECNEIEINDLSDINNELINIEEEE